MTKMQGSARTTARHADDRGRGLPCILVIGEAALAADLITQLIFKHLERNLAVHTSRMQEMIPNTTKKHYFSGLGMVLRCLGVGSVGL